MHEQEGTIQLFAAAKCPFLDIFPSGMSCLRNAWMYFNETYPSYSLIGPHDTSDISRLWVRGSRLQTTFSEKVLFQRRHSNRHLPSKSLVFIMSSLDVFDCLLMNECAVWHYRIIGISTCYCIS